MPTLMIRKTAKDTHTARVVFGASPASLKHVDRDTGIGLAASYTITDAQARLTCDVLLREWEAAKKGKQ